MNISALNLQKWIEQLSKTFYITLGPRNTLANLPRVIFVILIAAQSGRDFAQSLWTISGMGFEEELVRQVMLRNIERHGVGYQSASALLDAAVEEQR